MLIRHTDGVIYLTTSTVAELYGVDKSTVTQWKTRGLLQAAFMVAGNRPLYRLQDVARAERVTRVRKAKRRRFLEQIRTERLEDLTWPAKISDMTMNDETGSES